MNTRNATVLVVMAVVLGGGLVALQLASRPRSPAPPAGSTRPTNTPSRPTRRSRR
jgi:hypothetical protein